MSILCLGFGEDRVQRIEIPESGVVPVLVHPLTTTTVLFPYPITGYEGMGFSGSLEQGGDYYLNVVQSKGLVSLGVWQSPSPPRNLQIYHESGIVTLLAIPTPEAEKSVFQLHLYQAEQNVAERTDTRHNSLTDEEKRQEAPAFRQDHDSVEKNPVERKKEIQQRKRDVWDWQELRFSIVEVEGSHATGQTRLRLQVTNRSRHTLRINPSQVRVLVEEKLWKADRVQDLVLTEGESGYCDLWFPFGPQEVSTDSIYRIMLGYQREEEVS